MIKNEMIRRLTVAVAMCAAALWSFADGSVVVKSVEAHQRYPWNGLVDVVVTLEGSAADVANADCFFAASNSATHAAVPITSITQDGADAGSGTTWTRRFIWNAANDVGAVKIDDLVLAVIAKVIDYVQLWENGPCWAKCNIGASKPEEYGYYFWWGDTVGYKRNAANNGWISVKDGSSFSFSSGNCPTYNKSNSQLQSEGYIDATGNLVAAHDAATVQLGAPWRMPTDAEFSALISNCTTIWTTRNGVYGRIVAGKGTYASKSIFLPAAGYGEGSSVGSIGLYGNYGTSSVFGSRYAWYLKFNSSGFNLHNSFRNYGWSVRPLRELAANEISAMQAGVSTHLKLDCRTGVRVWSKDGEILRYDASWYENGNEVRITDNGAIIATGTAGVYNWQPESSSLSSHVLKLEILSNGQVVGTETAEFVPFVVQTVAAHQRYPWNGLVDIVVMLEGSADEVAEVDFSFAATNNETGVAIPIVSVEQNGADFSSGATWTRRFIWNATNDIGTVKIDELALTVAAKVTDGVQLWENGPYWAECNVGALKPEECGYYFCWGDTVGCKRNAGNNGWVSVLTGAAFRFVDSNCPTYDKSNSQLQSAGYIDATGNLMAAHDAATVYLGAPWRMPTDAEFSALISNCDTTWTKRGGVCGRLVMGRGDFASKSIFLPAVNYGADTYLSGNLGSGGNYWSSTLRSGDSTFARYLSFSLNDFINYDRYRYLGLSVRPVRGVANDIRGVTTCLKLDCRTGVRACSADGEQLRYDASWYENGTEVRIMENGAVVTSGAAGVYTWHPTPSCVARHALKLEVLSGGQVVGTETAEFDSEATLAHSGAVTKPAVEPTSSTSGMTAEVRCSRCNELMQAAEVIPALGYVRNVTARQLWPHKKVEVCYTLADDIGEVTGQFILHFFD